MYRLINNENIYTSNELNNIIGSVNDININTINSLSSAIGDLGSITTVAQPIASVADAIERISIEGVVDTFARGEIGNLTNINSDFNADLVSAINAIISNTDNSLVNINGRIGNIAQLNTDIINQNNLVDAINYVYDESVYLANTSYKYTNDTANIINANLTQNFMNTAQIQVDYYNKSQVDNILINNININLSNYYTKTEVNSLITPITSDIGGIDNDIVNINSSIANTDNDIVNINSSITNTDSNIVNINANLDNNYYNKAEVNAIINTNSYVPISILPSESLPVLGHANSIILNVSNTDMDNEIYNCMGRPNDTVYKFHTSNAIPYTAILDDNTQGLTILFNTNKVLACSTNGFIADETGIISKPDLLKNIFIVDNLYNMEERTSNILTVGLFNAAPFVETNYTFTPFTNDNFNNYINNYTNKYGAILNDYNVYINNQTLPSTLTMSVKHIFDSCNTDEYIHTESINIDVPSCATLGIEVYMNNNSQFVNNGFNYNINAAAFTRYFYKGNACNNISIHIESANMSLLTDKENNKYSTGLNIRMPDLNCSNLNMYINNIGKTENLALNISATGDAENTANIHMSALADGTLNNVSMLSISRTKVILDSNIVPLLNNTIYLDRIPSFSTTDNTLSVVCNHVLFNGLFTSDITQLNVNYADVLNNETSIINESPFIMGNAMLDWPFINCTNLQSIAIKGDCANINATLIDNTGISNNMFGLFAMACPNLTSASYEYTNMTNMLFNMSGTNLDSLPVKFRVRIYSCPNLQEVHVTLPRTNATFITDPAINTLAFNNWFDNCPNLTDIYIQPALFDTDNIINIFNNGTTGVSFNNANIHIV